MTDFLLELRSEEIPARMQDKARAELARLFGEEVAKAGLTAGDVVTYATPRRLALIAKGLPAETPAVSEKTKGPRTSAPAQALEGFLRKTGLTQDQLTDRDGVWFAVIEKPGRATLDVLAEAIPAIVRAFPWPKSMRWGAASASTESLRWVRPLSGVVALFGQDVVPCEVDGVLSGYQTLGHRFHHPGEITIGGADDYVEKLRACHVLVDQDQRRTVIRAGAANEAKKAGLVLVEDEGLFAENAGLTEWPMPMLGRFDPAFLEVPEEVIQLTARVNQKYFVCHDAEAKLANAFVLTANIVAEDGGAAIVAGNEKVLAARLSDAKFFWEQDLKVPLEQQAEKLGQIVFHEKLGTVADKVERVAKLARWLCEEGIIQNPPRSRGGGAAPDLIRGRDGGGAGRPSAIEELDTPLHRSAVPLPVNGEDLANLAERAARLCKADLVTGMVGEFPELQGVMGGHIARAQGEPDAVADAIRDHYKPVGQGDDVPTAPVTVAVGLADKLDTLVGLWATGEKPTGSKDPFALRRAAIGLLSVMQQNVLSLSMRSATLAAIPETLLTIDLEKVRGEIEFATEYVKDGKLGKKLSNEALLRAVSDLGQFNAEFARLRTIQDQLIIFLADRLKVQQREAGVRHDLIDAVFSLGGEDDLVRLLARVRALQSFIETAEGADLLAAYRRAANILKAEGYTESVRVERSRDTGLSTSLEANGEKIAPLSDSEEQQIPQTGEEDPFVDVDQGLRGAIAENPGRTEGTVPEGAEAADIALLGALDIEASKAKIAVDEERFEDAMKALAALREPIDRFFDEVMVNDSDPHKRAFRLRLLARFRDAVHAVADFSKIEG